MIIESESRAEVSNTRPARAFRAARDAVWEFSNNQHLGCQVPWKKTHEIIESNLSDTPRGFRPGRSNTDHNSLSSKILRNLGSMLMTY